MSETETVRDRDRETETETGMNGQKKAERKMKEEGGGLNVAVTRANECTLLSRAWC